MSIRTQLALVLCTALVGSCQIQTDDYVVMGLHHYPNARIIELAPTRAEVRALVVHSNTGDIVIHGGGDVNRLMVRVHERFPQSCNVELVNGRLELDVGSREALIGNVEVWLVDGVDGLVATTGAGDIFVTDLATTGRVELETGSGDVRVRGLSGARVLSIDSGAGDVDINDIDARDVVVETGAGDIALESVRGESVELESGIGDLGASDCTIAYLAMETGLGDIAIARSDIGRGNYDTGLGSIAEN